MNGDTITQRAADVLDDAWGPSPFHAKHHMAEALATAGLLVTEEEVAIRAFMNQIDDFDVTDEDVANVVRSAGAHRAVIEAAISERAAEIEVDKVEKRIDRFKAFDVVANISLAHANLARNDAAVARRSAVDRLVAAQAETTS